MDETSPKNRGRFVHFMKKIGDGLSVPMGTLCNGDGSSRGWFVQGTDCPGDGSSKGRIVQGTDCPGDGLSRGRIVQGTFRPGTHRTGTDRAGTDRQGTRRCKQTDVPPGVNIS
jgi:hypothetical protein